jgi:hypothetical protein
MFFHFIGLDEGVAGANVDNIRPTFIIPDDIDNRRNAPTETETRFNLLTSEVIPTKQWNTLFFFAQNLVSRFAVLYRIWKQQSRVFANRVRTLPIPAVRDLVTVQETVNGHIRDIVVSGRCTWRGWNLREVQNQIDAMTLTVFLIECQQEVEQSKEGLMHKNYNDSVHPISYSQFAAVFGSPDAWKRWYKVPASDWARTKTKYHANVAGYFCVSSQNTRLPGITFLVPFSFKADTSPADVAIRLLSVLTPFAYENKTWAMLVDDAWKRMNSQDHFTTETERIEFTKSFYTRLIYPHGQKILREYNVKTGVNSHSEDKVRLTFNDGFGFHFMPANPKETEALETIDEAMKVDYTMPYLFDSTKNGYTRWYVLCKDDTTITPTLINGIAVYPPASFPQVITPDELHDDDLFRYQFSNRRFAPPQLTKTGEKIDVAEKLNDDFGQMCQMVYSKNQTTASGSGSTRT